MAETEVVIGGHGFASKSAFAELGLDGELARLVAQIQDLYRADGIPWVVAYSGGKDSSATLQVLWMALDAMERSELTKAVHVITNDTLVENPAVVAWVKTSHAAMRTAAEAAGLPIVTHMLSPEVSETFWVNLIGRGYPAPNRRFRWCTERMKINPTTRFIRKVVRDDGEAIIILGMRRAESADRAARIAKYEAQSVRDNLSPHSDLPSALVYKPIVDWTDDDVWFFLLQRKNPWGHDNKQLMSMYRTASPDAECPVVMDTSTPSCGNSRFGCWTCTVVEKDKSMAAMIQNDAEKEWMQPLLDIRDAIAEGTGDRDLRDFRRLNGKVSLYRGRYVPGPFTQTSRVRWLRAVLEAQTWVRANGPDDVAEIELITMAELLEIRRIWVHDKREYEDLLPEVFESATGEPFPGGDFDEQFPFSRDDLAILREEATSDLQYELLRDLVAVEHQHRSSVRRSGLWDDIQGAFDRSGFGDAAEAVNLTRALARGKDAIANGDEGVEFEHALLQIESGIEGEEMT